MYRFLVQRFNQRPLRTTSGVVLSLVGTGGFVGVIGTQPNSNMERYAYSQIAGEFGCLVLLGIAMIVV